MPTSHKVPEALTQAQRRLKFEEFFYIQLQLIQKNRLQKQKIRGYTFEKVGDAFNTYFTQHLPFQLTEPSKGSSKKSRHDMGTGKQNESPFTGRRWSGKP